VTLIGSLAPDSIVVSHDAADDFVTKQQGPRFGGVSMSPLMSSRMVTRGYSLTRTYSARAPANKRAHADAAEGFTASGNYERMEVLMRSLMETRNDMMADTMQGMKDEMFSMLETRNDIMADAICGDLSLDNLERAAVYYLASCGMPK
jgi:hypothetical protein